MLPTRAGILWCALLLACAGPPPRAVELPLRDPGDCRVELGPIHALDVAVAIDGSRSTSLPSGSDIDLDGVVGRPFDAGSSDPHDSMLAAQVVAVRTLVHALAGADVRFSIVAFSGRSHDPEFTRPMGRIVRREQARIRADVTEDGVALERALDAILATGGEGRTDFAAGMNLAIRTLVLAQPTPEPRRRGVLFLTDSSTPIVAAPIRRPTPYPTLGAVDRFDPLMKQEALRAIRAGVRFQTFVVGLAVGDEPPHPLTRIAGATGGRFRAVTDPERLHCQLLEAVSELARSPAP